jgi:hypothetical protein
MDKEEFTDDLLVEILSITTTDIINNPKLSAMYLIVRIFGVCRRWFALRTTIFLRLHKHLILKIQAAFSKIKIDISVYIPPVLVFAKCDKCSFGGKWVKLDAFYNLDKPIWSIVNYCDLCLAKASPTIPHIQNPKIVTRLIHCGDVCGYFANISNGCILRMVNPHHVVLHFLDQFCKINSF